MLVEGDLSLFAEPDSFWKPEPEETHHEYRRKIVEVEPKVIRFSLLGHHSLWAHVCWNAGVFFADYIDANPELCKGKRVLELGCGAALPSMICALQGAANVVASDYPEDSIINKLQSNISRNVIGSNILAQGYLWGADVKRLLEANENERFDVIILSDLIFNHSEHRKLLKTCVDILARNGKILCGFSHHRPWLAHKDLEFFKIAMDEFGFQVIEENKHKMGVMFEEDPGDVELREHVYVKVMSLQ